MATWSQWRNCARNRTDSVHYEHKNGHKRVQQHPHWHSVSHAANLMIKTRRQLQAVATANAKAKATANETQARNRRPESKRYHLRERTPKQYMSISAIPDATDDIATETDSDDDMWHNMQMVPYAPCPNLSLIHI